jgi:hypothetical protein
MIEDKERIGDLKIAVGRPKQIWGNITKIVIKYCKVKIFEKRL